jgi:hypothetical protein
MLNVAKRAASVTVRFLIAAAAISLLLDAAKSAYAYPGVNSPNQVCQDTANMQLVQEAIAVIASKFPVTLGQRCQWIAYEHPAGLIEPAKWYFANYTSNGNFKQGSKFFNAVLDLKYACDRSGGKWGPVVFPSTTGGGGHSFVACEYYPKE